MPRPEPRMLTLIRRANEQGYLPTTAKELHALQEELFEPAPEFYPQSAKILEKHGFTREEWDEILLQAGTFYWWPTPEQAACNKEMRKLALRYGAHTPCWTLGYFSSELVNACRRHPDKVRRWKEMRTIKYTVNNEYIPHYDEAGDYTGEWTFIQGSERTMTKEVFVYDVLR